MSMRPVHPDPRRRGFTLVEILIVLVILGILAAVLVPTLSNRANLRISAAQRVLIAKIQHAQTHAISTNRWTVVMVDEDAVTIYDRDSETGPLLPLPHPTNPGDFVTRFGPTGAPAMHEVSIVAANFGARPGLSFDEMGVPHSVFADGSNATPLIFSGNIIVSSDGITGSVEVEPITGEVTTP
ncbi:MAG: type II secretion system protein [Planctomycetota bacterium]